MLTDRKCWKSTAKTTIVLKLSVVSMNADKTTEMCISIRTLVRRQQDIDGGRNKSIHNFGLWKKENGPPARLPDPTTCQAIKTRPPPRDTQRERSLSVEACELFPSSPPLAASRVFKTFDKRLLLLT